MSELHELLERVEKATGPDREIDKALAVFDGWHELRFTMPDINGSSVQVDLWVPESADDDTISEWVASVKADVAANLWRDYDIFPSYTASIDAALALVERVLPGWHWSIYDTDGTSGRRNCQIEPQGYSNDPFNGVSTSAPLAILAALLKALIAQEQQK